ncbi:uncharacterized protein LOC116131463 [Pistacia vera]|uniref:uncharacterized protein LOC116131463 n=1 Tax=Pistacia vera TaxID=55513 RepID=UPI001262E6AF|nr:uncharacterized protein LOC116131463 [Pistacia vera]
MASQSTSLSPPVFNGDQYHIWAVRMRAYLRGQGLWQYVEEEKQPPQLGLNPTLNQMRMYEEEMSKAPRALSHIHSAVTDLVFTRIMACETAKKAWDRLREESWEVIQPEVEKVKEYVDRLMSVVNKMRLLGVEMSDKMIVEKVLVSLPERFESKISSLEDSKDLSQISLTELVHALQAQEQRRLMRQEDLNEGAMLVAQKGVNMQGSNIIYAGDKRGKERAGGQWGKQSGGGNYRPCSHCKKKGHLDSKCWFRPGIQCRGCKQFGYIEKVCRNKAAQPPQQAQSADEQQ